MRVMGMENGLVDNSTSFSVGGVQVGLSQPVVPQYSSLMGDTSSYSPIAEVINLNPFGSAIQKTPAQINEMIMEIILAYLPYLNSVDSKVHAALKNFGNKYATGKLDVSGVPSDLTDIIAHIVNSTATLLVQDEATVEQFDRFIERLGEIAKALPEAATKKSKYYTNTKNSGAPADSKEMQFLDGFTKYVTKLGITHVNNIRKFNKSVQDYIAYTKNKSVGDLYNSLDSTRLFNLFQKIRGC